MVFSFDFTCSDSYSLLGGDKAPDDWQGGLQITYRLGPGFTGNYSDW